MFGRMQQIIAGHRLQPLVEKIRQPGGAGERFGCDAHEMIEAVDRQLIAIKGGIAVRMAEIIEVLLHAAAGLAGAGQVLTGLRRTLQQRHLAFPIGVPQIANDAVRTDAGCQPGDADGRFAGLDQRWIYQKDVFHRFFFSSPPA